MRRIASTITARSLWPKAPILAASLLASLCACTPGPDDAALCSAFDAQRSGVEVVADGIVTRQLGTQEGPSGEHEGFIMRLARGCLLYVRVETNIGFTGAIPLRKGEAVTVKGEYEYDPLGGVVHWTHRAGRSRHAAGYIEAGGRFYW